jgi:ElaA protein
MEIQWKLSAFEELSTEELYEILHVRQQVFIVEQQCVYQDCDGQDKKALHLVGWSDRERREPVAYLRIIRPKKEGTFPSIGRVLTHPEFRGKGLGREIMTRCLHTLEELYPESPVSISAQQYLISFYESFGFCLSSDGYEEDGIPHIEMTRNPSGK